MNTHLVDSKPSSLVTVDAHPKLDLRRVLDRSPTAWVRRPSGAPVTDYPGHAGWEGESQEYTRIWMGVTPPADGKPAYACVLGEKFDGEEWGDVRRTLVLLDETTSYQEALLPYGTETHDRDRLIQFPDMADFVEGITALKDLYLVDRTFGDPHDKYFWGRLTGHVGLQGYYPEAEDWAWQERFAFFRSQECLTSVEEAPYCEDEGMCRYALDSLFAHDRLEIRPHCARAADREFPGIMLAVAHVALAMEFFHWSELGNKSPIGRRGYDWRNPTEDERRVARQERVTKRMRSSLLFQFGSMDADRPEHLRERLRPKQATQLDDRRRKFEHEEWI